MFNMYVFNEMGFVKMTKWTSQYFYHSGKKVANGLLRRFNIFVFMKRGLLSEIKNGIFFCFRLEYIDDITG